MGASEFLGVLVAVSIASAVQSLSGFGFALLSVPFMAMAVDLREAVVISTVLGLCSSAYQARRDWAHVDRAVARRLVQASLIGMPFGLAAFLYVPLFGLKIALGTVVIAATILIAGGVRLEHEGSRVEWAAGIVSGILATSLSTNGPPLALLMTARNVPPDRFRATLNAVFTVAGSSALVLLLCSGKVHWSALAVATFSLPVMFAALFLGRRARPYVDAGFFSKMVVVLLLASGVSTLIGALR